ncbi:MarR family transcriptional regulator [Flavobacterium sp. Sd200]|uniref:MarR family winged helix-turn-helix transcriptional regulator n=1 Tax=Flavobacterium sp. Sd200 TaxID=2692211 RepID=UPI00136FD5DA|nr:MarR family transcriptional regulator [Flavobacterium sp. Sd200]MXN92105.1 MarR family transcriptional regulator [Flavobacterium sp. Sd200]
MKKSTINNIREFNRLYVNLLGVLNRDALHLNYSLTELRIVYEINSAGSTSAKSITETLSLDEGYTSRIITKLLKDKIVSKKKDITDKRIFILELTQEGLQLVQQIEKRSDDQIITLLSNLNEEEKERFSELTVELKTLLSKKK